MPERDESQPRLLARADCRQTRRQVPPSWRQKAIHAGCGLASTLTGMLAFAGKRTTSAFG